VNAFDRLAATPPAVSTRAELLQRLAERPTPSAHQALEPKDADSAELRKLAARSLEDRIAHLRGSLSGASKRLQHDQAKARLGGFARAQFDHERERA
jgi:hypothetical protein